MARPALSIAARLALAIGALLVAGGIGVSIMAYGYGRQSADAAYDRILAGAAFEISRAMSVSNGSIVVDLPISAFELLALAPEDRVAYRVIDMAGHTITGDDWVPVPEKASIEPGYWVAGHGGATFRFVSVERRFAERSYKGDVTVVVGHTMRARAALIEDITNKALTGVAIAGAVITLMAAFALWSALRPLTAVERALLEREPTDLAPLTVSTPRELQTVVGAINRFMARLEERVSTMQNLIGDASHQLKTPIAALRLNAELALEETDPDKLREAIRRIHRRAGNLSRLSEQMLSEAMIIHRADSAMRVPIDLRRVAMGVAEDADHYAEVSGLEAVHLDLAEDPVMVEADGPSLAEAAKNLVSNAYRYGRTPIRLTVAADAAGGAARLIVADRGEGFAEAGDAELGRRFRRYAGSRADSAGLGLAIVRAVAVSHRGEFGFGFAADGSFAARLVLPLAKQDVRA